MSLVINQKLKQLSTSSFRSHFHLTKKDLDYIGEKGLDKIKEHAYDFIKMRLAPLNNPKDGHQTPMRGHPVFVAQHATATCCRGCLAKWHHISKEKELSPKDIDYIVTIIMTWIEREMEEQND